MEAAQDAWRDGDYRVAGQMLEELLASSSDNFQARHFYGVVLTQIGNYENSIKELRFVCEADPENVEAWADLANVLHLDERFADAEFVLRSGIEHNPTASNLYFNLGVLLKQRRAIDEAEAVFLRATELDANDQASWIQLGLLRYAGSRNLEAAQAFLKAVDLNGDDREHAIRMAGFAFADSGCPEQAERLLASLCPEQLEETEDFHLLSQLLFCRLELCNWLRMEEIVARCKQFIAEGRAPLEPFSFLLLQSITADEQLSLTAQFVGDFDLGEKPPEPVARNTDSVRRLRLGYLSSDFHDHAVMRLLIGVLEHHDRATFEVHAFSYGGSDDSQMRRRIVSACAFFHDVTMLAAGELAQRIRDEGIDILIDLTGWTGNTRSAVLGLRPAPVQVNWLGYTGTLGSRKLADYLIGDSVATPLSAQRYFAEELMLMPVCCQPNDDRRKIGRVRTREEEGLPANGFVFCCFSRPLKITPQIFQCWCSLLAEVSNSVLWLYAANETATANLVAAARQFGVDPSRLIFSPAVPPEQHLARLSLADLALDTFPFGAHTTASDALWAGLPVITVMGETFPGRVTASMLHAIGLSQLAAPSLEEYRMLALKLAQDRPVLMAIQNQLKLNRLSAPLFDTKKFTVDLEDLLRSMWRRYCCGHGKPALAVADGRMSAN